MLGKVYWGVDGGIPQRDFMRPVLLILIGAEQPYRGWRADNTLIIQNGLCRDLVPISSSCSSVLFDLSNCCLLTPSYSDFPAIIRNQLVDCQSYYPLTVSQW